MIPFSKYAKKVQSKFSVIDWYRIIYCFVAIHMMIFGLKFLTYQVNRACIKDIWVLSTLYYIYNYIILECIPELNMNQAKTLL